MYLCILYMLWVFIDNFKGSEMITDTQKQMNERIVKTVELCTKAMMKLEQSFKKAQKQMRIMVLTLRNKQMDFHLFSKKTNEKHYGPERIRKKGKILKWGYPR